MKELLISLKNLGITKNLENLLGILIIYNFNFNNHIFLRIVLFLIDFPLLFFP